MERKIGLLGLTYTDPNKGCEALTFTFLDMIRRLYPQDQLEIVCFMRTDKLGQMPLYFPQMKFKAFILNIYSIKSWFDVYQEIKTCSCIFDASYGDGFTGIYGTRRNFVQALRKQLVYWAQKPLYLLPQTYGKYKFPFKRWSIRIIKKAKIAYARDENTARAVGSFVKTTSDMAFGLPFNKNLYPMNENVRRIGVNVSSLLWDATTCKRFNLTVNYKKFYYQLLDYLIKETDFEVHIIPHVLDIQHPNAPENDYRICQELKLKYTDSVILAPPFETALEAKSYIANMDVFVGSRMHATIGAISAGVTTIPLSYAYKFEALYANISYPYLIRATKVTTEEALRQAKEWIAHAEKLHEAGTQSVRIAKDKLHTFEKELKESLENEGLCDE